MYKKLIIAGTLLVLLTLTVGLCSAPASSAAPRYKALRYRVIGHMKNYDVVRGHHRTLRVGHHRSYVDLNGVRRYRVVKRNDRVVVLRRVASVASTTPVILRGAPVSVGMPSTASSVWTGTPPAAANDGQADTRWAAAGSRSYPQWWAVDLGGPTTVYGVKAAWYATKRAYRYRIETSLDGVAFTTVADRSRNQTRGTTTDALTVVARYVRVTVLGVSPSGVAASAYEITVNGDVGSTPPPTPTPTPTVTPAGAFNVMTYGAKGDGVTDDYDAVQAAINACGTTGGVVFFPQGTYLLDKRAAGGLKLPAGNTERMTLSGYGATIKLSANVPRFLDFHRTADYQTFAHFWVEGFDINADNVAGKEHVVGFSYINGGPLRRINVADIMVRDIHAYNILTDTTYPNPTSVREGVFIGTYQEARAEAITNTITDVFIENVHLEGGTDGFVVGGVDYSRVWPQDAHVEIDNVHLDGCSWDSGVRAPSFWTATGMHMGWGAKCGSLYVSDCTFKGSGDNNFEVNSWHYALIENCVSEDANNVGYFFENYGLPIGDSVDDQQVIWRNCVHRQMSTMSGSRGWSVSRPNASHPVGTITLDGCSMSSIVTDTYGASFFDMPDSTIVKKVVLRGCSYSGTGMRATTDSWPFVVNVRCGGSPDGGPTSVTLEACNMYFRSTRVGSPAYVVRLVGLYGNLVWSVSNCQFDAAVINGASHALRVLCLGDAVPTVGSGVVDNCTFKTDALAPLAVVVGDAPTLTIPSTVVVENCDFREVDPDGTNIYVAPGNPNQTKIITSNNAE